METIKILGRTVINSYSEIYPNKIHFYGAKSEPDLHCINVA